MLANRNDTGHTAMTDRIRRAETVTPELMRTILQHAVRLPDLNKADRAVAVLDGLIKAEAWIDAALAWAAIETPQWRLRRLAHDGEVWHCALSCRPQLPIELDDTVDSTHSILPLAIVLAVIETRSSRRWAENRAVCDTPPFASEHVLCCDNFG